MLKSTHSRFFIKNLFLFLIPLLISLITLGSLSTVITQKFVKDEINKNNVNMLLQAKENIELILNEVDSLNLNFSTNPEINSELKRILRMDTSSLSSSDFENLSIFRNFIDAPANSRPYIHSIYLYFNNTRKQFITTTSGLTTLNEFYDTTWYHEFSSYEAMPIMWTEIRNIKQYSFETKSTKVLTIYRKLYSPGAQQSDGIIVLNVNLDYIKKLLGNLNTFPEQNILIVNQEGQPIIEVNPNNSVTDEAMNEIIKHSEPFFNITQFGLKNSCTVSQIKSNRYGLKYISVVPQDIIYNIPIKLSLYTTILLVLSFVFGLVITFYLTNKNYKNIQNIISIIDSAESGHSLPPMPSRIKDEYGYIIQNILKTFIEHSYLKVQLSERKYKIKAMELLALQSQINPHFLFNTLETINWKAMGFTGKPNEVNKMISNLSDILKYSLQNHEKEVTIKEEIWNTKSYLAIQKIRYKDKFDVIWEYDEELEQYNIIKLILQPLIENSIYHGIKEKEGKSSIKIKLLIFESHIKISIIDTGLGISREKLTKIKQKLDEGTDYGEHIGLYNTNKRLRLSYGDQYGIKIRSKPALGTIVYMYIPIKLQTDKAQ